MSDTPISIDEFLSARKDFVKDGGILVKSLTAPASWDPENRTARFVMSAEIEDRDRDIIVQAGLDIEEFMKNPVAPLMHRSGGFPVGTWENVEKVLNGRPKRTEGTLRLVKEGMDPDADRLAGHIGAGTIRACSIGFIPKEVVRREVPEDQRETYWPGYEIRSAELIECSPVTIPSNPAALAKMAAEGETWARDIIEEILDTYTKTGTGLIVRKATLEQHHKEATGQRISVTMPKGMETIDEAAKLVEEAFAALKAAQERLAESEASEADAAPDDREIEMTKPQARGIVRRALDLLLGSEANEAKLAHEIAAREAAEAEAQRALDERRTALKSRLSAIDTRLKAGEAA